MTIVLILLAVAAALELLLHVSPFWRWRRFLAVVALIAGAFAAGAFVMWEPNVFSALFGVVSVYRLFNLVRVVEQRMHEQYLRTATRRTTLVLLGLQTVVLLSWWAWLTWGSSGHLLWAMITGVQALVALLLLLSLSRNFRRMRWPAAEKQYTDSQLPTVTVAIPARNETEDLQQCLQHVIASTYPKLEILVLDDCSQTRRTPEIIRSFAHDGVRFIKGQEPSDTWLPKNGAYHRLAEEANGSLILFCGVDVRLAPHAIRELVDIMQSRNKQMMSVLPRREHDAYGHLSLIQAMRYWWELVPPRRLFRRPPVLSSCWIISAKALKAAGGFAAVARAVVPEAYFAKHVTAADGYSFLMATAETGISSNKPVADQHETAVRTRYPQLHRRPEQVALFSLLEVGFLLLPFVIAIGGFWVSIGITAHVLAAVAAVLLSGTYLRVVLRTHVNTWWFGLVGQPLMILVDLGLLHYSMYKYEFSVVDWKGRNVCIPAMYVMPHLPKLD